MGWAMLFVALLTAGLAGAILALVLSRQQRDQAQQLISSLREELGAQQERVATEAAVRHQQDLQHAVNMLLSVAGEQLEEKARSGAAHVESRKELIDAELHRVTATLSQLGDLVGRLERERAEQLGQVAQQLQSVSRMHGELQATTGALREALSSSQARGQWGERMAEDVLTAAGFKLGVNYVTQRTLPNGGRPDVTFLLPGDLCLHMDVKFPLANYVGMLEADTDAGREDHRKAFLRDVRARVRELAGRGYVDPANGTVDCMLLFIPNEQVYGFVHEQDATLLDDALRQGVVICAPSTLFAVLAVIRQSCDTVALQRTSDEILGLLGGFTDQWERYVEEVDRLGRQLDTVRKTYDGLSGTRRRQLERQLEKVEEVRQHRGVPAEVVGGQRPRLLRMAGVEEPGGDEPPAASAG